MIVIRIIMIIIRIMIIIMYCITYDMVSIMSCSALFDYVILYVILFGSGILRYGFHIILYHRILYYSILYLCSVLRIIFYLFEVISRSPKRTSLRIIDNIIQSWGWKLFRKRSIYYESLYIIMQISVLLRAWPILRSSGIFCCIRHLALYMFIF